MKALSLDCPNCGARIGGFYAKWSWFTRLGANCPSCARRIRTGILPQVAIMIWSALCLFPVLIVWALYGFTGFLAAFALAAAGDAVIVMLTRPKPALTS